MAMSPNLEDRERDKFVDSPNRASRSAVEVIIGNPGDISSGGGGASFTTPLILNQTFVTNGVEQSFALPANCKGFIIRPRQICKLYVAYITTGPYFYCGIGSGFKDTNKYMSQTIYYYTDRDNTDIDIITYV